MTTKTKKHEVAKGESDKLGDKYSQIGILPLSTDAIPSVEILQTCGVANLECLLTSVENALRTDDETCLACNGECKITCFEEHTKTAATLKGYATSLREAIALADEDFPLLPDLRTRDWFETNDKFVAFSVWDRAGESKHLDRTVALNPTLESCTSENGDPTFEVKFEVKDLNCPDWSAHGTSVFDLHSPYIMTSTEETFFSAHPDALKVWLSMCGNLYPEFAVCDDVKDIFAHKLTNLHEPVAV